jgi:hypothetical protein
MATHALPCRHMAGSGYKTQHVRGRSELAPLVTLNEGAFE